MGFLVVIGYFSEHESHTIAPSGVACVNVFSTLRWRRVAAWAANLRNEGCICVRAFSFVYMLSHGDASCQSAVPGQNLLPMRQPDFRTTSGPKGLGGKWADGRKWGCMQHRRNSG
ncbi:hypothetical protein TRVL_01809 [Trypanosoma vivax]|nr:hypothetical protein TRVL_01809 [Trypanosoma vivax]